VLKLLLASVRRDISPTDPQASLDLEIGHKISTFLRPILLSPLSYYFAQVLVIALILSNQLDLPGRNLAVPIDFWGDTVYHTAIVNSIIREGWWWHVTSIGAPVGVALVAAPILGNLDCLVMRFMALFVHQAGLLLNLYWIMTILVAGPIAAWCLMRLGVHRRIAFVFGILYALSPHIYYRHTAHLMLAHHLIPFACTVSGLLVLGQAERLRGATLYILLGGCVLIGFSYTYWAFFACFIILAGGITGFLRQLDYKIARLAALAAGLVIISAVANLLPSAVSWVKEPGGRTMLTFKNAAETDVYGLKIRHLITPTSHSPLPMFAKIAANIRTAKFPMDSTNEGTLDARMGACASLGFLILMAVAVLTFAPKGPTLEILRAIAVPTLACILLATVGGFGSLFNLFVRPDIRAYNRISIFVAFYSLAALSIVLTKLLSFTSITGLTSLGSTALLSLLLMIGVADQNESSLLHDRRAEDEKKFRILSDFVGHIEHGLPPHAMVYQLPHVAYGDGDHSAQPTPRIWQSAPEEPFLLSTSVRWSFPAISSDAIGFARRVGALTAPDAVETIRDRGFLGLLIDKFGYTDEGKDLIAKISGYLGQQPLQSADQRYVFYNLRAAHATQTDRHRYVWGTLESFQPSNGAAVPYLEEGWSCEGCTEGKSSTMDFDVAAPPSDVTIKAHLTPVLFGGIRERTVRILADSVRVGEWKVGTPDWFSTTVPRKIFGNKGRLSLRFELPDAASPESVGLNLDTRVLSVSFDQLVLLTSGQAVETAIPGNNYADPHRYVWGTSVIFHSPTRDATPYLGEGWSCEGCTEGKSSTMYFGITVPSNDVMLKVHLTPALFGNMTERLVQVIANAVRVGEWKVRGPAWYSVIVPRKVLGNEGTLALRFQLPNASSPKSLGLNLDSRELSVAFDQLILSTK